MVHHIDRSIVFVNQLDTLIFRKRRAVGVDGACGKGFVFICRKRRAVGVDGAWARSVFLCAYY
jgi:hypothetical protein